MRCSTFCFCKRKSTQDQGRLVPVQWWASVRRRARTPTRPEVEERRPTDAGVTLGWSVELFPYGADADVVLAAVCHISCKVLQSVSVHIGACSWRSSSFCCAATTTRHADCTAPSKCMQPRHYHLRILFCDAAGCGKALDALCAPSWSSPGSTRLTRRVESQLSGASGDWRRVAASAAYSRKGSPGALLGKVSKNGHRGALAVASSWLLFFQEKVEVPGSIGCGVQSRLIPITSRCKQAY